MRETSPGARPGQDQEFLKESVEYVRSLQRRAEPSRDRPGRSFGSRPATRGSVRTALFCWLAATEKWATVPRDRG